MSRDVLDRRHPLSTEVGGHNGPPLGEWHQGVQWCAETLLAHSDSRSPDAEWLRSPRLRMPTIRLLLLITGNLRSLSVSMCRIALARSSSSRQQWMPGVITSRAIVRAASKLSCASPLQTMSRSVTMPISLSFSPIGMAPMSCSRINLASSVTGVSGLTQSTPLCITSLTFMADSVAEVCVSAPVSLPFRLYDRLGSQARYQGRRQSPECLEQAESSSSSLQVLSTAMLYRVPPAGFIEPCLPIPVAKPPVSPKMRQSRDEWRE